MAGDRGSNSGYKRGIIRENDPENGRSKVEFIDEDGTTSRWLKWNMPAAGATKVYNQPDIGSQVNCILDHHGEDGAILGAIYSKADRPPTGNGKLAKMDFEGGLSIDVDKATGSMKIEFPGLLLIRCGGTELRITSAGIFATAAKYEFD